MLKVLTQYYEATGDLRVIATMQRYFEYQLAELPKRNLRDWGKFRWQGRSAECHLFPRTRQSRCCSRSENKVPICHTRAELITNATSLEKEI
jgi:hypothetical protein